LAFTSAPLSNKSSTSLRFPVLTADIRAVIPRYKKCTKMKSLDRAYFNCNFAVTSRSQYSCNVKWPTDSPNTWNTKLGQTHWNDLQKSWGRCRNVIKRIKPYIPANMLQSIYSALIQPYFEYCSLPQRRDIQRGDSRQIMLRRYINYLKLY
jgi:hypothetical protein